MGWFTAQLAILLILAFLLGVLAGYLWWIYGYRKNVRTIEDANQHLRTSLLEVQKASDQHKADAADARALSGALQGRVSELEGQLATSQAQQDELGEELAFIADDDLASAADADNARQDADALFAELQAVSADNLSLRADLDSAVAANALLSRQIQTLQGDLELQQTQDDVLSAELEQAEVAQLRSGRAAADAGFAAADELAIAITERDALTVAVAELSAERDTAADTASRLKLERDELRVALSHAQAGHDATRAEIAALVSERDRLNQAVQSATGAPLASRSLTVDTAEPPDTADITGTTGQARGTGAEDAVEPASFAAVGGADADYATDVSMQDTNAETSETPDGPNAQPPNASSGMSLPGPSQRSHTTEGEPSEEPSEDDLTRIEGIGPAMSASLKKAGITTYQELSTKTPDELKEIVSADGLRLARSVVSWPNQASLLARGQFDLFDEYTDWLDAGVPPSDGSTFHAFATASFAAVNPDDLKRIEGIGPAMERALNAAGITTYAQLHDADQTRLRAALDEAGLRLAPSLPTWAEQAGFLVRGDEDGFLALTSELTAGRRTGDED